MAIPIIRPDLQVERWSADEMKVIERCDDLLRRRGMQMAILCVDCVLAGRNGKVTGDNARTSNVFSLTCACKRREYRPATA